MPPIDVYEAARECVCVDRADVFGDDWEAQTRSGTNDNGVVDTKRVMVEINTVLQDFPKLE